MGIMIVQAQGCRMRKEMSLFSVLYSSYSFLLNICKSREWSPQGREMVPSRAGNGPLKGWEWSPQGLKGGEWSPQGRGMVPSRAGNGPLKGGGMVPSRAGNGPLKGGEWSPQGRGMVPSRAGNGPLDGGEWLGMVPSRVQVGNGPNVLFTDKTFANHH